MDIFQSYVHEAKGDAATLALARHFAPDSAQSSAMPANPSTISRATTARINFSRRVTGKGMTKNRQRVSSGFQPTHTFTANSSGCIVPSATLFTVPVIMIEKPSPIPMLIVPPGM